MATAPIRPRRVRSRQPRSQSNLWVRRAVAASALTAVIFAAILIAFGLPGAGSSRAGTATARASKTPTTPTKHTGTTPTAATGSVPVLTYHVVAAQPPGASNPDLYVPQDQFSAQMQALRAAGWHAVTLDQLEAHWSKGTSLGPGKPIVLTFDTGYHSQYANALPVLKSLGWVGVENLVVNGLSPSEGGISDTEVRGLLAAGWELDTQGVSHRDLIALGPGELQTEVASARQLLSQRYSVPVNWFCYPLGHYNDGVVAAVKAAGYTGATTAVAGLASASDDPYRLPRLTVLPGTSPSALLGQIASAQGNSAPTASYTGPGFA